MDEKLEEDAAVLSLNEQEKLLLTSIYQFVQKQEVLDLATVHLPTIRMMQILTDTSSTSPVLHRLRKLAAYGFVYTPDQYRGMLEVLYEDSQIVDEIGLTQASYPLTKKGEAMARRLIDEQD